MQWKNHGPESSNGPNCPCPPPWMSQHPLESPWSPHSLLQWCCGWSPAPLALPWALLSWVPHPALAKPIPTEEPGAGAASAPCCSWLGTGVALAARPCPARPLGTPCHSIPRDFPRCWNRMAASQGCFQSCKNIHLHSSPKSLYSAFFFFLINQQISI